MSTTTAPVIQTTQVYSVFIRASAQQVWDAIIKPEFTTKYFYGSEFQSTLEPGTGFTGYTNGHKAMDGEVLESNPPFLLRYSWRGLWTEEMSAEAASRVSWEIEPQDGGVTKLTVVHDELERSPITAGEVAGGWMFILSGLKTLLETGEPLSTQTM
jgi:uncharacterized protein YndB with AHSA1/START domain